MSYLWIYLALLFLLQNTVSSDDEVSLKCPKPLPVKHGLNLTINCTIEWKNNKSCNGTDFFWKNQNGSIKCDNSSETYCCGWDYHSYMFLTIFKVEKEENFTAEIWSTCGLDHSPLIIVEIIRAEPLEWDEGNGETESHVIPSILGVLATIAVVAILSFLIFFLKRKKKSHEKVSQDNS